MSTAKLDPEVEKLVRLVASMSVDYLMGKGCTDGAYVMNLHMIADSIDELNRSRSLNDLISHGSSVARDPNG